MKIAIMGGSFNPPHLGHVAVIKSLASSNQFDELWILPCLAHPFEKKLAPYGERLKLCKIAFENISPSVHIKNIEEEIQNTQGWSLHTLQHLRQQYPQDDFFWVMGSDLMQEKNRWKDFDQIEKLVKIYPIPRAGYEQSPFPKMASSEIREKISKGESIADYVSKEVEDYIQQKGLYS